MSGTVLPSIREVLPEFFAGRDNSEVNGHGEDEGGVGATCPGNTDHHSVEVRHDVAPRMTDVSSDRRSHATGRQSTASDRASRSRRKYACHLCSWRFERPSSLANHMNSHTGAKPHTCAVNGCDRAFRTRSNMLRHLRTCHQMNSGEPITCASSSDNVNG